MNEKAMKRSGRLPRIEVVDLFCGIGGLSYGLRSRGLNVLAGFDLDATCQFAYEANSEYSEQSWGTLVEVGAAWITSINNKIFNIPPGHPDQPLENEKTWHTTIQGCGWNTFNG